MHFIEVTSSTDLEAHGNILRLFEIKLKIYVLSFSSLKLSVG